MKRLIIICLLLSSFGAMAQTKQTILPPADSVVTVKLKVSELNQVQLLLKYLYEVIRTSGKATALEAEQVRASVEQVFPAIVADKPKETAAPKTKP